MLIESIPPDELPSRLYFSFQVQGSGVVTLYTPDGVYNLDEKAVGLLMKNLQENQAALEAYNNRYRMRRNIQTKG